MGFRVPILDYFQWQPMVLAIDIKNISEVQAIKGNRYIISDSPNIHDEILGLHPNCIMYYGDNDTWYFDEPHDAWTTVYKERKTKIDNLTGEIILDSNNNPEYIDVFHVIYYSELEKKWKSLSKLFSYIENQYDRDLGCFIIDNQL